MLEPVLPDAKRGRGRPVSKAKSEVVDRLLAAAEFQLENFGLAQFTERTIAEQAQVNHAMIRYYFGSMEGLLAELLDQAYARLTLVYRQLAEQTAWLHDNPTRHLIKTLVEAHYARPWLVRIAIAQLAPEYSAMRDTFAKRYGPRGQLQIQQLIEKLVGLGIYDRKVDARYVSMSLMSVITAPLVLTRMTDSLAITIDDLRQDRWIDHLTDLFDRQLRSH